MHVLWSFVESLITSLLQLYKTRNLNSALPAKQFTKNKIDTHRKLRGA